MQFEVNGQNYFLNFLPEKGSWFLFKPTHCGIQGIPVTDDDEAQLTIPNAIEFEEPDTGFVN